MVGPWGIIITTIYLVALTLLLFYCLVQVWPYPTPATTAKPNPSANTQSGQPAQPTDAPAGQTPSPATNTAQVQSQGLPEPSVVTFFGRTYRIWDEVRLLLIVMFTGALGSIVHSLRSLYWYVGNRALVLSWLLMYVMLPFVGSSLALVFYFVIRGGFFSPQSSFEQTSPFGFAAFSALIGMFSQQAVLKLRDVADTLLVKPPPGEDTKAQDPDAAEQIETTETKAAAPPAITAVAPNTVTAGATDVPVVITGSNFKENSVVLVNGVPHGIESRTDTTVTVHLSAPADPAGGLLAVSVVNPEGGTSNVVNIAVTSA
jgi:hypothetical protein